MSARSRHGVIAGATLTLVCLIFAGARLRLAQTQQTGDVPTSTPRLFALSYAEGHDLAGFTGRPMLLVFGDSTAGGWTEFLLTCEADEKLAAFLAERYQGVFVDAAVDKETFLLYGSPKPPCAMLKDLRGPIHGVLEGAFSAQDLLREMQAALPVLPAERSPAYIRLLEGTDLLDELKEKEEIEDRIEGKVEEMDEAARVLRLFKHYEGGTPACTRAIERAQELGIAVPAE